MMDSKDNVFRKVNHVLQEKGGTRQDGKVASERTKTITKDVVNAALRLLHKLGYKIQDPQNLTEKHIGVLVKHWFYEQKKGAKTIENEISRLNRFCEMMGKSGMVKRAKDYLPEVDPKVMVVKSAAQSSRSWAAKAIDIVDAFERVDARCPRLGAILRMELAFGLRLEEALKSRPHEQGKVGHYVVLPGQGKSGRYRDVITMTEAQHRILDYVKSVIGRNEPCGWLQTKYGKASSLKQNRNRFYNEMKALGFTKKALGVTGHDLRAQFSENNALALGLLPPSLGGTKGQMQKEELRTVLNILSEAMGHHRERVMASYYTAFSRSFVPDAADRTLQNIRNALPLIKQVDLKEIPSDRRAECSYIRDLLEVFDLEISLGQVHSLWAMHCRRNGVAWMAPEVHVAIALEAQALGLLGKHKNPTMNINGD